MWWESLWVGVHLSIRPTWGIFLILSHGRQGGLCSGSPLNGDSNLLHAVPSWNSAGSETDTHSLLTTYHVPGTGHTHRAGVTHCTTAGGHWSHEPLCGSSPPKRSSGLTLQGSGLGDQSLKYSPSACSLLPPPTLSIFLFLSSSSPLGSLALCTPVLAYVYPCLEIADMSQHAKFKGCWLDSGLQAC